MFDTHIDKWDLVRYVEEIGFENRLDSGFADDLVRLLCGAGAGRAGTKRIGIGTGVAIPGT